MAKRLMAIPVTVAVVLGSAGAGLAQATDPNMPMSPPTNAQPGQTRAEAAIDFSREMRIADLPAGHWATNATQVAVSNNILPLMNGQFMGQENLTHAQLRQAMTSVVSIAENIAGKGTIPSLRAAVAPIASDDMPVTRLELAQSLARVLDALNTEHLIAMGTPTTSAGSFKDLGGSIPTAVRTVVDKYGIMTGFPNNTFRPSADVNRYQMAAIALEMLRDMREAPIAQQPVQPNVVVQPSQPNIVVVTPPEEPPIAEVPVTMERPDHRSRVPIHLAWQALNATNLQPGAGAFNIIPVQGTFTGYQGPVMLQNVTNFRYDLYQSNFLDSQFRLGYSDLKWGMLQFIPFVQGGLGLGASVPTGQTQYDTYVSAGYGGTLSIMPLDNLDLHGTFSQGFPLAAGRWNSQFQAQSYPNALGSVLSNYGVGVDFYVSPNIALTLGAYTWQLPNNLNTASDLSLGGVSNTYGGNIGVGFGF